MPSCGEAVAPLLEGMGARTVFGIPGVHTLEIYRGLSQSSLRHVAPRHEQGAGFMADGWARVSGKFGVCTLIGGPGLTNAITPIAQAYHDSIPMLVISGAVPEPGSTCGEIHDLPDQQALMSTVTAFSHTVRDPAELPEVLARAVEVFESRRARGPVHVAIAARCDQASPCGELDDCPFRLHRRPRRADGRSDRPRGATARVGPAPAGAARWRRQGRRARGAGARAASLRRAHRSDDQRTRHRAARKTSSVLTGAQLSNLSQASLREADAILARRRRSRPISTSGG